MLTKTGATTNAHRKGGPRSRAHNDDRFKGTLTGVAIPEAPRGSDGIEDFENLLESGYDSAKPSQQLRNIRHRSPNGVSNSTNMTSEKPPNDDSERPASRSRVGPSTSRSMRSVDMEYAPVPSSRPNSGRNGITHSPTQSLRKPSPAYNSTTAHPFPAPRASQSFGALSSYQNDQPDAEAVMEQYVDYDGGALADQDSPSPPPMQTSSPPQALRKLVHSPLASRTPKRTVDPVEDQDELDGMVSQKVKGKQRAAEELDERPPLPLSRKSNGKRRADLIDDEVDEVTPTRKTASARSSGDMGPPTSKSSTKNRSSTYSKVHDDTPAEEQYNDPLLDNGDDFDRDPMGMEVSPFEEEEEPPKSAPEHSDAGSEEERQPTKSKEKVKQKRPVAKAKEKGPDSKKKRPREDDEEAPRQKKKPKSTDSRASARAKSKEPDPDRSFLEELVSPSEGENEEDEGVRRSRRAKIAPVKFWLGERLEYDMYRPGTNRQVPTIIGVRRVPEAPAASLARRRKKGQTKGRSKSRRLESEDVQSRQVSVVRDESGWEEETVPVGTVLNYETGDEVEKLVVFTSKMVSPKLTEKGHFLYQRIFADEKFVAAGQLVIPGKSEKPKKSSKDNTYVFYLIEGVIHVIVHETKFYLAPGGMFMVPRGNHYYIRNMKDYDAKLFFVQGRLMTTDDFEGSRAGTARAERSPSRARAFEDSGGAVRSSSKGDGLGSSSPQKRPAQRPKPGASAISSSRR